MRKILPSILILLVIVNIFAPFSVQVDKNKISLKKNIADAAIMDVSVKQTGASDSVIDLEFKVHRQISDYRGVFYTVTKTNKTSLQEKVQIGQNNFRTLQQLVDQGLAQSTLNSVNQIFVAGTGDQLLYDLHIEDNLFTNPPENTGPDGNTYKDFVVKKYLTGLQPDTTYYLSVWGFNGDAAPRAISYSPNTPIHTAPKDTRDDNQYEVTSINTTGPDAALPVCWLGITEGISMSGCIAQFIYYFLFVPTSFIFALTGTFFDWTFHYTIQDTSYSSSFVVEGWGVVRDFCNIFFIFVLLYIAFRKILGLGGGHGGPNPEKMVINVIIIGLLINFSLFAAQLVIDSSNILARVFYNSNSIKITKNGANGVTNSTPQLDQGLSGELPLSAALVNKVNPQSLIIQAKKVGNIKDEAGKSNETIQSNTGVSNGTFILVTILAIAVNIVGLIVFISIGLMCISRVVGLWIYMILAPLAFFSYTVPSMQGLKVIGWRNWWSQLLCMSFWAPLLIFFLYLILKFLETGFDLIGAQNKDGLAFVISIIVPFAFIMTLLWKAKDLAKDMGCELANKITGGVAAAGGLMLGGAALGISTIGRGVGGFMGKVSQGSTATQKYQAAKEHEQATGDRSMLNNLNWSQKLRGKIGSAVGLGAIYGKTDGSYNIATRQKDMKIKSGIGGLFNKTIGKKQEDIEHIDHDRHDIDAVKNKRYADVEFNNLSQTQRDNVKNDYIKENRSKFAKEEEEKYRNTNGIAANTPLSNTQRTQVKANIDSAAGNEFEAKLRNASRAVNGLNRALSQVNTGSWSIGNLSQVKQDKREDILTKTVSGIMSFTANQLRQTILKGANINYGTGQKDFFAGLKNTITEAFKSANIKVDLKGGEQIGDDHGHGGGGHH